MRVQSVLATCISCAFPTCFTWNISPDKSTILTDSGADIDHGLPWNTSVSEWVTDCLNVWLTDLLTECIFHTYSRYILSAQLNIRSLQSNKCGIYCWAPKHPDSNARQAIECRLRKTTKYYWMSVLLVYRVASYAHCCVFEMFIIIIFILNNNTDIQTLVRF